jgi:hypothetical protein
MASKFDDLEGMTVDDLVRLAEMGEDAAGRRLLQLYCVQLELKGERSTPLERYLAAGFSEYLRGHGKNLEEVLHAKRPRGRRPDLSFEGLTRDMWIALTVEILKRPNGELTYEEAVREASKKFNVGERRVGEIYSLYRPTALK